MKFLGWLVLALIGLVVAFIFFGFGYHKSVWYDLVPYRWYDEVVLDVTVESERMQISATSECRWRHYVTMPDANRTGYKVTGGIVAKRLPSGAALVVQPRAFCHTRKRVKREGYDGYYYGNNIDYFNEGMWNPQPVTDAPLMLWLDDAKNPTQIEAYVSLDYYEHPNARVKLHGFTRQAKRRGSVTDVRGEVPWLAKGNSFWSGPEDAETWIGSSYRAVSKDVWARDPLFSSVVSTLEEATFILQRKNLFTHRGPIDFREASIVPMFIENRVGSIRTDDATPRGQINLNLNDEVVSGPMNSCRGELPGTGVGLVPFIDRLEINGVPITPLPEGSPELKYPRWAEIVFDPQDDLILSQTTVCVTTSELVLN